LHPLLEKAWMSIGDWPTWEKVVWRLSLVAGGPWVLLGFYGVVVVKPTGYVNTDEFTCSELQEWYQETLRPDYSSLRGRPGESLYDCHGVEIYLCKKDLVGYFVSDRIVGFPLESSFT